MEKQTSEAAPARLDGVAKRYGTVEALKDVTFTIDPGEIVALLGPNGAGKTTAVRMILGLAAPDGGTARVFGLDPRVPANRIRTGAMLQTGKVPDTLRVGELVDQFASYYGTPVPIEGPIGTAGLRGLERRRFGDLSGGQRQRVLFALALAGDPDLVVLDEPTVGLDVEARRGLWASIRGIAARGKSVLLTTHYLEEADALADRVIVIHRGEIIAEGSPGEIKARTAGRRIRCGTTVPLDAIRRLPGVSSVSGDSGKVEILATRAEPIVRELLSLDPALRDLEIAGAGLEEAFLSLTVDDELNKEVA